MGRCYPADLIVKFRAMLYVNFSPTVFFQAFVAALYEYDE